MDETAGKLGFFERIFGMVHRHEVEDFEDDREVVPNSHVRIGTETTHHLTVRRQVVSFQDAVAAADGLKRGETQIINLSSATTEMREKIKDFMCGVNYTAEGSWEEIGDFVFILAPATMYVEVAPCSPATGATRGNTFI